MQSKKHSAIETATGTAVGFLISWAVTPFIMYAFGYHVGPTKSFGITVVFTVISLVRGYYIRRVFNWIHTR